MKVINLTRGFKSVIDDCDYALVSDFKWHARVYKNKVYAARWVAQITENGKPKRIGRYKTKIEAATAYDKRAKEIFGEYARPNFQGDN